MWNSNCNAFRFIYFLSPIRHLADERLKIHPFLRLAMTIEVVAVEGVKVLSEHHVFYFTVISAVKRTKIRRI
jgi:hypothetical protein